MVGVAQLVEHQIVALGAEGSNPSTHPSFEKFLSGCGAIGSALALGARGCEFESRHPDHFFSFFFFL